MNDTETRAERSVADGTLYLRRRPGDRWEINFFERELNLSTPLVEGVLRSERLADHHFAGQTFETPDEAADAVRRVIVGE